MEKVCITGMGVVSPLGIGISSFWEGLVAGRSGVVRLDTEEFEGLPSQIGACIADTEIESRLHRKEIRRLSRASQMALVAAGEACAQAGLDRLERSEKNEVATIVGSSIGGFAASDPIFRDYYTRG